MKTRSSSRKETRTKTYHLTDTSHKKRKEPDTSTSPKISRKKNKTNNSKNPVQELPTRTDPIFGPLINIGSEGLVQIDSKTGTLKKVAIKPKNENDDDKAFFLSKDENDDSDLGNIDNPNTLVTYFELIWNAIVVGNTEEVKKLLPNLKPKDINSTSKDPTSIFHQRTLLDFAMEYKRTEIIKILMSAGANIYPIEKPHSEEVRKATNIKIAKTVISKKTFVDNHQIDNYPNQITNPLLVAVQKSDHRMAKMLLDYKADPNGISINPTSLPEKVRQNDKKPISLLLENSSTRASYSELTSRSSSTSSTGTFLTSFLLTKAVTTDAPLTAVDIETKGKNLIELSNNPSIEISPLPSSSSASSSSSTLFSSPIQIQLNNPSKSVNPNQGQKKLTPQ